MAAVLVVALIVAGVEINHLHNQVDSLQDQMNLLYNTVIKSGQSK